MGRDEFSIKLEKLVKSTKEGLAYYSNVIKDNFKINPKFKAVSYMIFDTDCKPYIIIPQNDYYNPEKKDEKAVSFDVYAMQGDSYDRTLTLIGYIYVSRYGKIFKQDFKESVLKTFKQEMKSAFYKASAEDILKYATIDERIKRAKARKNRIDELDILEITKGNFIFKGIGKEMFKVFEYNSFVMGATKMTGKAYPLNEAFINKKDLYKFYRDRGVKILPSTGKMLKAYDADAMKRYTKRIATFSKDGVVIKVVYPEDTKTLVMDLLKQNTKTKDTSVFNNLMEL